MSVSDFTLSALSNQLSAGKASAVELAQDALKRIEASKLNAFVDVMAAAFNNIRHSCLQ